MVKVIKTFSLVEKDYMGRGFAKHKPVGISLDLKSVCEYLTQWAEKEGRSNGDVLEVRVVYKQILDIL